MDKCFDSKRGIYQIAGNEAAKWLKRGSQNRIISADGVGKYDADNPFRELWKSAKGADLNIKGLRELMAKTPEMRALLNDIKPAQDFPDVSTKLVDDADMYGLLTMLADEAKEQNARSSASWKKIYEFMQSSARLLDPSKDATRFQLNLASSYLWATRPRRTEASEDLALKMLCRCRPDINWVKVLESLDFHDDDAASTRSGTRGADAKLHEAMLNVSASDGKRLHISFRMSDKQLRAAKQGKLEYIVLIVAWRSLFVFDFLLLPVKTCLLGTHAPVSPNKEAGNQFTFKICVEPGKSNSKDLGKQPSTRAITDMSYRHEWLCKFINSFRTASETDKSSSAAQFYWFDRHFGQKS